MLSQTVPPPSLITVVADKIREAILSGLLPCGSHLNEAELSKKLNVSRGTLREALHKLQEEYLVDFERFRGCFVIKLTKKRAEEIYTLRSILEPYAVQIALKKGAFTSQDLKYYETLIQRLGELEKNGDLSTLIKTDMELHLLICKRSEHTLLLKSLEGLQSQTQLFILNTKLYHSDSQRDEASHLEILEAIRSGHPAKAEETMRKHIVEAGTLLVKKMEERCEGGMS